MTGLMKTVRSMKNFRMLLSASSELQNLILGLDEVWKSRRQAIRPVIQKGE